MTLKSILPFLCLLCVLLYTYTMVGLELFAYKARIEKETGLVDPATGEAPLFNLDTFLDSFTSVFMMLINDNGSLIYYTYYRAVSPVKATLFWLTFVILGSKIMLNLFIAILLQNFTEGDLKARVYKHQQASPVHLVSRKVKELYERLASKCSTFFSIDRSKLKRGNTLLIEAGKQ